MAAYYYAAHFNTPLMQSPAPLASHHPFGIPFTVSNLPTTPAKTSQQAIILSPTERRILFADHKPHSQHLSPIFRLPAELRNQIYEALLCPCTPHIKDLSKRDTHVSSPPDLHPAILSTCRRIHDEATDLLYKTHIFHAHPSLLSSLPHLGSSAKPVLYPTVIAKIKRWQLIIRLDTDPRFSAAQATAAFSGAEFLEVRVWQSMFDGADSSVLKLLLGIRGVGVARLSGSVEPELARWLEERMMADVEMEEEDVCRCGNESGVKRCGDCKGTIRNEEVVVGKEWFGGRNAWQFGNR
ncbi:hypothetical protein CC86DRAFT_370828 [Ophiobolus disseminans]|uniref:2EXR domain-containing protein n=1 Tax=Ophiobolus disseminans TaxID=1469910 RepID=A0A6A6ZY67_9PLEO|nr:hypothetical protein CC86DRAFT_370828 [Ophiobolus disseminans]